MIQTVSIFDLEKAKSWLRQQLSSERFQHSLGAQEKAIELAEKFQCPPEERERASVAALLHDAAKCLSPAELLASADHYGLSLSDFDRQTPQTLHAYIGAELLKERFGVADEEVLNAIRYHTTGRVGMSRVEKIVYVADKIEGNTRNPLYSQKMTAFLDFKDPLSLDLTMLYILDSTIQFLIGKHQVIHPRTMDARNDFVVRLRAERRL